MTPLLDASISVVRQVEIIVAEAAGQVLTANQIRRRLVGAHSEGALNTALARLVKQGVLRRVRRGEYMSTTGDNVTRCPSCGQQVPA